MGIEILEIAQAAIHLSTHARAGGRRVEAIARRLTRDEKRTGHPCLIRLSAPDRPRLQSLSLRVLEC